MLIKNFEQINAVLFDFDGIIVDSEKFFFQSCKTVLKNELNIEMTEDDYYRYWTMLGEGLKGELKRRDIQLTPDEYNNIETKRESLYYQYCLNGKIQFIQGMLEAVEKFSKITKTAIASNTKPEVIKTVFHAHRKSLPCPIIGKQKGLRGKPEPDILIYACGFLNTQPASTIIVEDSYKGLAAAEKICMKKAVIKPSYWDTCPYSNDIEFEYDSSEDFVHQFTLE